MGLSPFVSALSGNCGGTTHEQRMHAYAEVLDSGQVLAQSVALEWMPAGRGSETCWLKIVSAVYDDAF
eukprot:scaffold7195_cov417-Prasinococcus_capsulatus_cf.AAC.3